MFIIDLFGKLIAGVKLNNEFYNFCKVLWKCFVYYNI